MIEMLVAMSVFTVLLSIVMTGIVTLSRSSLHAQNSADTAADVRTAFETMDKQVRYADAVNFPGAASGDYWVEFRTLPVTSASVAPVPTCVQWRYVPTTGQFQERSWPASSTASLPAFATLFTTAATTSQGEPFTMLPATTVQQSQELTVALSDTRGADGSSALAATFVARNSTAASAGNTPVDASASPLVSASPVCAPTGYRS